MKRSLLFVIIFSLSVSVHAQKIFADKAAKLKVAGTYKQTITGTKGCAFVITVKNTQGRLSYNLNTGKKIYKGSADLEKTGDGYFLSLKKIPWAEMEGDMTAKNYKRGSIPKPDEIDFSYDEEDGSLILQNYGNAMNRYVVFAECDEKVIELRKN